MTASSDPHPLRVTIEMIVVMGSVSSIPSIHIDHHLLMERIRARIGDLKVTKLVRQFLRAGVLEEGFLLPTTAGTPQGGVISPLLANIALSVIEERYERWVHHRQKIRAHRTSDGVKAAREARMSDRRRRVPVFFPIRYADDFVSLVSGTREQAEHEKVELAVHLRRSTGLELSEEKTRISALTEGIEFLGHRVRLKWHRRFGLMPRIEIPKLRQADLRYRVKQVTKRATINRCLSALLQKFESDPTRLGQLLPLLHRSGPALCVARPLCRRPSVALAHEEARQPPPEKVDDSAIAESGPSHPDGLAREAN